MNQWTTLLAVLAATALVAIGCSGSGSAVTPTADQEPMTVSNPTGQTQTHLWGYYDCVIDIPSKTVIAVPNRHVMFTANVVNILNSNPASLAFHVNEVIPNPDYVDVDIDVSLTHPFPGMNQFDGYDVRGVFMGNGSGTMGYNTDLNYPVLGVDQYELASPVTGFGDPDGYTRWFNRTEFGSQSNPLFGYTQGWAASPGFAGTATLCPYKYFSEDLVSNENLWSWLVGNPDLEGRFSAGATATRNYYLRFPTDTGVDFGYAVVANWDGPDEEDHPANAPEAVAVSVTVTDHVFYVDPDQNGGNLILDISVFDWDAQVAPSGIMEDYKILIESTVLSAVHEFDATEMTPFDGNEHYSTYHCEIPADNVTSVYGNEFWVIVECSDADYSNEFDVPNTAWDDSLAAFLRYDLKILSEPPSAPPICDLQLVTAIDMPYVGWPVNLEFDASGSYSLTGDPLTFDWDFDNDGVFGDSYNSGTDEIPTKFFDFSNQEQVCVKVSTIYGESICCVPVDLFVYPSKNIPLEAGLEAIDLGVREENGDLYILYRNHVTNVSQAWKYEESTYYQTGTYDYSMPTDWHPDSMDVAPTGYAGFGVERVYKVFTPGGVQSVSMYLNPWVSAIDISSYNDAGTWTNDLFFLLGGTDNVGQPDEYVKQWWHLIRYPNYDYASFEWCGCNYQTSTGFGGLDKMYYDWVRGVETDVDGDTIWVLEQPDYYGSNWTRTTNIFLTFTSEYFGDGTDSSWTDARDLARDPDNRFLVLDYADDQGFVSVWTGDVAGGSYIGEFGDAASISEEPRRMDGSDFDGCAFVLHGDSYAGTDCYKLSIFLPDEMPD